MAKKKPPKAHRENLAAEFRLLIEHFENPLAKKSGTVFMFRTAEEFQNFVYELVVETKMEDHKIIFNIVGLKTPMSDFPRPGPAICRYEMENLKPGDYTLLIHRRGKQMNQFKVSIKKTIKVVRSTKQGKFIDVTTDHDEWSLR
ncbi:MAG: hypothetical protein WAO19_00780 [Candidatus Kryptoniota bacterium]